MGGSVHARTSYHRSMANGRWEIPLEKQARAIQQLGIGWTARQIFMNLWPTNPPVSLQTFTNALVTLQASMEGQIAVLMREAGSPTMRDVDEAGENEERLAELMLAPAVQELPLPPGDNEALAHLDGARQIMLKEMYDVANSLLPGQMRDSNGRVVGDVKFNYDKLGNVTGDPRSPRAATLATLGNAITANVGMRLRASQMRVHRTVIHHNLRLARKDEAQNILDEVERDDRSTSNAATNAPAFAIDLNPTK